jgi:hypothetical protein
MNLIRMISLLIAAVFIVSPVYATQNVAAFPAADESTAIGASAGLPFAFEGPPPPVPPAVISRDESGRATIRAVRIDAPLRIDGMLDEPIYSAVPPITEFLQMEPRRGEGATEKTEVWVSFDRDHVYVSFRCFESDPARVVANEMRRDVSLIWQGDDIVSFMFDSYYDRQTSVLFSMNSIGGRNEGQVINERYMGDWNPIWSFKTGRFEGGWTVEASVPFKSLRYRPGRSQLWGFNAMRTNRWKNEIAMVTLGPPGRGQQGIQNASYSATMVGIEAPPGSRNLEVKPYVVSDLKSDRNVVPRVSNDINGATGLDVKYGLSQNITADLTFNTDFAQVEADEQQVNLTRFSVFFPEKRDFFLENQSTFSFGGALSSGDTPVLFHSRRIGLNQGRIIPIEAGGRLTGRLRRYSFGLLNIRTGDEPTTKTQPTNFSVVRIKRDVFQKSSVGMIYTGRSVTASGIGGNTVYGVDGAFNFYQNLAINTYWAKTSTQGQSSGDSSYRAQLDYNGDRYGVQLERLTVGNNFNPEVGFVRRHDMRRTFGLARFSPRPARFESVRKFSWTGLINHVENGRGQVETREADGEFGIEFQNSDKLTLGYRQTYEFLPRPFTIARDISLPVQEYEYGTARAGFSLGLQRKISAQLSAEYGSFYNGHRTALSISRGRVNVARRFSTEPTYSINWVDLEQGSFKTHLLGSRVTYTISPVMFTSALIQYNSGNSVMSANIRYRWEYRPGSELFVVYNEERDTRLSGFPDLANRALIFKITRLFRF